MKKGVRLFLVFLVVVQCVGIFDHSLWTPDEPRVAEIAREMAVSGDFLIPQLLYHPFLEKPPVYFALAGFFYKTLGTRLEGVGRLASVIFALATLLVVFYGTRRLIQEEQAYLSTLILATSFKFFEISHKMTVDIALVFFITAALFSFILAHEEKLKHGYKLFWISMALAFLSKGIIGLAIPGISVGVFVLWQNKDSFLDIIKKSWFIPGTLIVLASMALWARVIYLKGGMTFVETFFVYNQIGRFIHGGLYTGGHIRPFYYYIPTVLADAAPWSVLLIPAVITAKKNTDRTKFFLSWFFGGLILLSMASTKRGLYFLPMYPAMAVLIAVWIHSVAEKAASGWERGFMWFAAVLIALSYVLVPIAYVKIGGSWLTAVIVFLLTLGLVGMVIKQYFRTLPYIACTGWALLLLVWSPVVIPQIDTMKSYKPFFQASGKIVNQQEVSGYHLTETVEALCPFYGQFFIEHIEKKEIFKQEITSNDAEYLMVLPSRLDKELQEHLTSRGEMVLETKGHLLKKIQLWRLKKN